jgi:hypothetical protein
MKLGSNWVSIIYFVLTHLYLLSLQRVSKYFICCVDFPFHYNINAFTALFWNAKRKEI